MAIALVSMDTVEYRSRRIREYYEQIEVALTDVPGLRVVSGYPKALRGGFYGNLRAIYHPEELGGLSRERFLEAVTAEGAALTGRSYPLWHLCPPFARGMAFYDDGRGPLTGDYRGYQPGDLPITEEVHPRILAIPALIEPKDGYVDQLVAAIRKVVDNHQQLL
jgi:dTDP-4-amino-4,6-dideoxygalactose transaminase